MKRTIFTLLFLLLAASALAQDVGYFIHADCGALTPAPYNTVCEQSTTVSGRTAGQLYVYDGATWVSVTASSSGGHVIKDDGAARPQRTNLDFIGTGVSCVDSSGNDATECTVDVGGAPPFDTVTTGVNTTATMTVGTGAAITTSGSGTIAATTAAAFPSNPADCAAGSGARGVTAAGVGENCVDFMEEPSGTGIVAKTAANASTGRTITGVTGNISCTNGDGVAGNPTCDLGTTAVQTDTTTTYGAFNQDFTAASVTLPNSAGATPASDNQMAVDTTAGSVKVKINSVVYSLATTLGTFDSFSVDPAGCVLADGTWTNDIDASGVSNCVPINSSGAAAPTVGTSRFVGELYQDTRTYSCTTQAGLPYIAPGAAGTNFVPLVSYADGYTAITADSGTPLAPCGPDTLKHEGSTTVVTATVPGTPGKVTYYSKLMVHATDCTGLTAYEGQACFEKDANTLYVCEPTSGDCDTAGEWTLISGGGAGGSPGGSNDDVQYRVDASTFGGGRCTMTTGANLGCAGTITSGDGTVSGLHTYYGAISGTAPIGAADVAGSPARINWPINTSAANAVLTSDGGTPQQTRWETPSSLLASTVWSIGQLPTAARMRPCEVTFGDPGAASPVLADDNDSLSNCKNSYGVTLTITSVHCYAPVGSPTVTPIITGGGGTSILTGALTCSSTAGGAPGTLNSTSGPPTQAANGTIDANITAAGGVAKYIVLYINRTL